jgi:thioredoxin reductase
MSIHLIIIGAGLAGLSAAISTKVANPDHKVTILESVKELAEIGVSTPLTYVTPLTNSPSRPASNSLPTQHVFSSLGESMTV